MRLFIISLGSVCCGLLLGSFYKAIYEIAFGLPAPGALRFAFTNFYDLRLYQSNWLGFVFVAANIFFCLTHGNMRLRLFRLVVSGAVVLIWTTAWFGHLVYLPLHRVGGGPNLPEYVGYGCGLVVIHLASSVMASKVGTSFSNISKSNPEISRSKGQIGRSNSGFTLVELLTVIGIAILLAGILFPVMSAAKHRARVTEDLSGLRQTYTAICLYEGDNDHFSPMSLYNLIPLYEAADLLKSKLDTRDIASRSTWPANVWVDQPDTDGAQALVYTRNLISFAFLKPFENRFPKSISFETYRNDPNVALLLDPAIGNCRNDNSDGTFGCVFPQSRGDFILEPGHPAFNIDSWINIRTDGSATHVHIPDCRGNSDFSYEQMFLFENPCGGASAL